jgi:hypothetical protein
MSCNNITGRGQSQFLSGRKVVIREFGTEEVSETYLYRADVYDLNSLQVQVTNELGRTLSGYNGLKCVNATVTSKPGFHEANFVYKGLPSSANQTSIQVEATLSTEPIDTHANFEEFGGTPDAPLNNAEFNEDGTFKGFAINDRFCPLEENSTKQGVTSYLEPACTITEIRKTHTRSRINIGTIYSSGFTHTVPGGSGSVTVPNIDAAIGSRDFLIIGQNIEPYLTGIKETRKYRMSGIRRWNNKIYK